MHCYQLPTDTNQSNYRIRKHDWHWRDLKRLYESDRETGHFKNSYQSLSKTERNRFALVTHLNQLQDRHLYHLTLSYKPYADRDYKEQDVNQFFIRFYLRHFLPFVTGSKHFNRSCFRQFQPLCYAFVDGHAHEPVRYVSQNGSANEFNQTYLYPARLHHHAILAVHPSTIDTLQTMLGDNTFATGSFSNKVMTSNLVACDASRLFYASKRLEQYPDFLAFPDRWKSVE